MDFVLTPEQEALRDAVRKQLTAQWPPARIRALEGTAAVDPAGWRELGASGVFSLRRPEADGGAGLGMAESVLVFEQLGRALVPGPLVASALASGLVAGAAAGEAIVGTVADEGAVLVIEHLDGLDQVAVVRGSGVALLEPAELMPHAVPVTVPLDPLTPLHRLSALPAGEPVGGPELAAEWRRDGAMLTAGLQLGIAGAVTDASVDYAKTRVQFDKPIGAFQAVKHLLADMLVRTEMARAAVYAAAVTIDDPEVGVVDRAVSTAKVLAGEAALANAKAGVQVHGGMGFTWEMDLHRQLKRAWVLDTLWGSIDTHTRALAAAL